ncbi:hypothetical protein PAECIP111891_02191 [Paenibacillus allorhizoplanae]|uniref:DUF2577 domain-containing protein n=1 Tax=Paenibacillus allorhizoplanae TaxID=2905648 RepID=A0ABN8G8L0_9BACL|nr:DUF2577 domain-containing protein [Paenibacillus allorhizoplanae]CAH1202990.1 hypothetical protein PAECIP111891_02191 [Paenibacillus allorhizoplanae]
MRNITALVELMKQAGSGATEASKPVNILFGEVTNINPLEVTVDQRFALDEDFLVIPEQLTPYSVEISSQTIVIRRGLDVGESLILLRIQGGQQYIILDRVVNE